MTNRTNPTTMTPRQMQLLELIHRSQRRHCYSPTISELAAQLGLSRSTVYEHIDELRKKQLLATEPNKARSLTLTAAAQRLLRSHQSHPREVPHKTQGIRIAGRVAAGIPTEAIEQNETLDMDSFIGHDDDLFALQVTGDSMIEEGINEGDYVICRKTQTAHNGQLVVAAVGRDEATLKRFFKENDHIRLEPANCKYEPIIADDCRIEGVVTGLMRRY